ncbi:MAG TPA: glycerophosphodiester phosphodiesterase family protein, partial [Clostridia bacterium]|nr:glycerophosphodiester phosphodiesterase family protein [Clostridia bacterium]
MQTRETIASRIREALRAQGVLIAAHRGTTGGNIVENTTDAYQNALLHGADIVEMDIVRSVDGKLFLFHDGNEKRLLQCDRNILTMGSKEIESFTYRNPIQHSVNVRVNRLEDALRFLKGRALINADRCWDHWLPVFEQVGQAEMFDQVVFKSPVRDDLLDILEAYPVPVLYMPIVRSLEDVERTLSRKNLNTVGLEMVFDREDSPLADPERIARWKETGLFVWANPIT